MKNGIKFLSILLLLSLMLSVFAVGVGAASVSVESPDGEEAGSAEELELFKLSEGGARALLIILSSLFGLVLPLVPITVFTLKLIKKRREFEVVDYIILGVSILWLMSGALIFAMVL